MSTAETLPATQQTSTHAAAPAQVPAQRPDKILAGDGGLALTSIEDYWRFSTAVLKSGLAPKGMDSVESIVVAIQMGAELGLKPMASLQNVAVINGRPSVWGDAMLAVCRASGVFDESVFDERIEHRIDKEGGMTAVCTVRRLPNGKPVTREFTMLDAATAKLTTKDGPWKQYTKRMLQMRARSWALRDAFSDVLKGIPIAEEVMGSEVIEVTTSPRRPASKLDALSQTLRSEEPEPQQEAVQHETHAPKDVLSGEHILSILHESLAEANDLNGIAKAEGTAWEASEPLEDRDAVRRKISTHCDARRQAVSGGTTSPRQSGQLFDKPRRSAAEE